MKDNFSSGSDKYAQYRPTYPEAFFDFLKQLLPVTDNAWDCATGNGQVAQKLALIFNKVYATDISQSQLDNAVQLPNIHYALQPAESTSFQNHFFDLIIVGQAVHWFQFDAFYAEVKRTGKEGALIVLIGYGNLHINTAIDAIIHELYETILGPYWDAERRYVDEEYQTLPFPFEEIEAPQFDNTYQWTLEHLVGYLNTWSAVKHYTKQNGHNPVDVIYKNLQQAWGSYETLPVHFPLLLRIGRITKMSFSQSLHIFATIYYFGALINCYMKRKQTFTLLLLLLFTVGTLLFIKESNDHKECSDRYESTKDSNGNLVVSKQHICQEKYSF